MTAEETNKVVLVVGSDYDVQEIIVSAIKMYAQGIEVLLVPDAARANWILHDLKTQVNLIVVDNNVKEEVNVASHVEQTITLCDTNDPSIRHLNKHDQSFSQRLIASLMDLGL